MRILISLSYYIPNISGLTVYVKNLAEMLAKKHHVTILTAQYDKKLIAEERIQRVRVRRVPVLFKFGKALVMPRYPLYVWEALSGTDTIFINLPQFEGCIVALLAKILKKKTYCIYHCEVTLPNGLCNRFIEYSLHTANYLTLIFADKIITYTEDYANHSKLLPKFKQKLLFTYPLIKAPVIDKNLQQIIRKNMPEEKKYIIGIAARVSAEKGIEYLFQAIPLLEKELGENFLVLIAGPKQPVGEESYMKQLSSLINQYEKYIYFLDTIPYEKLGSFYSLLDVLVLPSINATESFGIVQVEAMLSGVPVAASNLPGVRVPVQKTGMGKIVPIKNSRALGEAIIEIMKNKKEFTKDKDLIEKEFSFDKTMEFYNALFT